MLKKYISLKNHIKCIEKSIDSAILRMGEKSHLRDACEFALKSGGKRFRPILVLLIAEALKNGYDAMEAALSCEFFHTASLIADDLPCMDNETIRRGKPTLHVAFSESTAVLASYTLIALGYESIYRCAKVLSSHTNVNYGNEVCMKALKAVSACAGINGATNGQFLDLDPPDNSLKTLMKIIEHKTVTLFEVSYLLGWIFGGGDLAKIDLVKTCAYHLGMAFQIADDINDVDDCHDHTNIVQIIGMPDAKKMFEKHFNAYSDSLTALNLKSSSIDILSDILWDMSKSAKAKA